VLAFPVHASSSINLQITIWISGMRFPVSAAKTRTRISELWLDARLLWHMRSGTDIQVGAPRIPGAAGSNPSNSHLS